MCTLAALKGNDRDTQLRFAFRVYDETSEGLVRKAFVEQVFHLVYGDRLPQKFLDVLEVLFPGRKREITWKEFENIKDNFQDLTDWMMKVLDRFFEFPPRQMLKLFRQHSGLFYPQEDGGVNQLPFNKELLNSLRGQFHAISNYSSKSMSLTHWRSAVCSSYLLPQLCDWVFLAQTESFRTEWRYQEFFTFCFVFGFRDLEKKADYLINMLMQSEEKLASSMKFYSEEPEPEQFDALIEWVGIDCFHDMTLQLRHKCIMFLFLVNCLVKDVSVLLQHSDSEQFQSQKIFVDKREEQGSSGSIKIMKEWSNLQLTAFRELGMVKANIHRFRPSLCVAISDFFQRMSTSAKNDELFWKGCRAILLSEMQSNESSLSVQSSICFPGLLDLRTVCTLRFLLPPCSAREEKECVTECILRYMALSGCSSLQPYGRAGTQWAIVDKRWYDNWQMFVGQLQYQPSYAHHYRSDNNNSGHQNQLNVKRPVTTETSNNSNSPRSVLRPDPIDNAVLILQNTPSFSSTLIPNLVCGVDVELLPPAVFVAYQEWYGGGPTILRCSVNISSLKQIRNEVDLYPMKVTVVRCDPASGRSMPHTKRSMLVSRHIAVDHVLTQLSIELNISTKALRVYLLLTNAQYGNSRDNRNDSGEVVLLPDGRTVAEWNIVEGSVLLLEQQSEDGSWPRADLLDEYDNIGAKNRKNVETMENTPTTKKGVMNNSSIDSTSATAASAPEVSSARLNTFSATSGDKSIHSGRSYIPSWRHRTDRPRGLDNLGNTCYLNASLQALSHIPLLTDYFASGQYLSDLNPTNSLGHGGRLAVSFAKLLGEIIGAPIPMPNSDQLLPAQKPLSVQSISQSLHFLSASTSSYLYRLGGSSHNGTESSSVDPKHLYYEISQLREQFSGNEQHDAQELLLFLLDGLAEDLCFVSSKPYVSHPDSEDTPASELAQIWWKNHLLREQSFITALFAGQFHSILSCETCGFCSQRFEAFTVLPLPLPEDSSLSLSLTLIPSHLQGRATVTVHCDQGSTLALALRNAILSFLQQSLLINSKKNTDSNDFENDNSDLSIKELCQLLSAREGGSENSPTPTTLFVDQWLRYHWLPADVPNSTIRSFLGMHRRVETIRDLTSLHLYNSALPWRKQSIQNQPISNQEEQPKKSFDEDDNNSEIEEGVARIQQLWCKAVAVMFPNAQDSGDFSLIIDRKEFVEKRQLVRVAFQQRRATFRDGSQRGICGYDDFIPEPMAFPLLEVLPECVSGSALYSMISARFASFFNTRSTEEFHHFVYRYNTKYFATNQAKQNMNIKEPIQNERNRSAPPDSLSIVSPASSDDVFAGAISTTGFTLRLIGGGVGAGTSCSRCHWLSHCEGCIIPNNDSEIVQLSDGESIAVDWHSVVISDVLNMESLCAPATIVSSSKSSNSAAKGRMPLQKCFEKFGERQRLDDVVCPGCVKKQQESNSQMKLESKLWQSIRLWRLPPLLVLQLKRFQYDRASRRKLYTHIDFPLQHLNMKPFLSEDASNHLKEECTSFKLLSVIHHVGVMGGGHYLNTSLEMNEKPAESSGEDRLGDSWWLFNDHIVSVVTNPLEVISSSAYLLFYIREDMVNITLGEFLSQNNLLREGNSCSSKNSGSLVGQEITKVETTPT